MAIRLSLLLMVAGLFSACSQTCLSMYDKGTPNYKGCLKTAYRSEKCTIRLSLRKYTFQDTRYIDGSKITCE